MDYNLSHEDEKFIEDWVEENSDPYMKQDFKNAISAFLERLASRIGESGPPVAQS